MLPEIPGLFVQTRVIIESNSRQTREVQVSDSSWLLCRRRQSLQRVHEEGKRVFDELSEKLYTLEAKR